MSSSLDENMTTLDLNSLILVELLLFRKDLDTDNDGEDDDKGIKKVH